MDTLKLSFLLADLFEVALFSALASTSTVLTIIMPDTVVVSISGLY